MNIVPIKLKLTPEILSRNKTLDSLSKRLDSYGEEISKTNKRHKVSFLDQVSQIKILLKLYIQMINPPQQIVRKMPKIIVKY